MQAWQLFLESLDGDFGKNTVDTWVRSLKLLRFDACNIYLEAKDSFQLQWAEEHLVPMAKARLRNNNGHPIKLHLSSPDVDRSSLEPAVSPSGHCLKFESDIAYPHATLEQYIPAKESTFSFEVLCKLLGFDVKTGMYSEYTGEMFNPIYLYGPKGSGKSHLLMAAATFLQIQGKKVLFVKAETFTEHVVGAIRTGRMKEFRAAYRSIDVLIIDDVEVFGGKNATQEELFHTFNTLHTAGKQIILSAHVNPRILEYIEERLVSRFEWGITLPLEKMSAPSSLAKLLNLRLSLYPIELRKPVTEYLLKHFTGAATLSSAIETLAGEIHYKAPLELHHIEPLMQKLIQQNHKDKLDDQKVLEIVAATFGIKVEDILGKSQTRDCVLPRQIAMYLLRKELNLPYTKIGKIFKRDHSTVMSSIKQIIKGIESQNDEINYYLNSLLVSFPR